MVDTVKICGSRASSKGIFTSWLGIDSAREAHRIFTENRIPSYQTPTEAVRGFMQMVRYRRGQEMMMETPPNISEVFEPDPEKAQGILNKALGEGRTWLTEIESRAVLSAYKIQVVETYEAKTSKEAARLTQIDYDREMALVLCDPAVHKEPSIYGKVRLSAGPGQQPCKICHTHSKRYDRYGAGPDAHETNHRVC